MDTLIHHPIYTNLKIYPYRGELERDIGLLNELSKTFNSEVTVYGKNSEWVHKRLKKLETNKFIKILYSEVPIEYIEQEIVLAPDSGIQGYTLSFNGKVLHFQQESVYNQVKTLNYKDNLICLAMIVKDAGPNFENVLRANKPFIDRWCILDTGSTDGTQTVIKQVLKDVPGELYEEPFINFRDSRNRCLELAGTCCKFIVMLDDTYELKGDLRSFLHEVRGDQFSDSFSLMIQSDDTEYYSNRIIKSETKLRYIHTIHEVITDQNNINVTIPVDRAFILDHRSEYMESRTINRKQFDLDLLFKELEEDPDDPRTLYYIAQTYGCMGDEKAKAEYFEKRIVLDGYIQEKIDATFELARTYNFKINPVTKEPLTKGLNSEEWEICEKLYLQAYSMDTTRPDGLYFLGIHSYLEQDYQTAYFYFKRAFEIGYPIGSQYSLKPTLSFHFLPKFLTETAYYQKEYRLGEQAAKMYLEKNPHNETVFNWYRIHTHLTKMELTVPKVMDRQIICFVTDGGWEPWTGRDIEIKGMGGSETWIIETARAFSDKNYHVVVFCKTNGPEFYERVGYNPIEMFPSFIGSTMVEHLIVSRYTEYIPLGIHGHAKNVHVIFHDNISPELIIPVHPKVRCLWGLTDWHSKQIQRAFPQFPVNHVNYGIDQGRFHEKECKPRNFIYSSFPNRGLIILLTMWPKIQELFPDATLSVYCNLEHKWVNEVAPDQMRSIKTMIHLPGVTNYGWVSKRELAEAWNQADFWFYPCIFEETFCLTALEAAISRTCVITNGLAALSETAKHGVTVEGDPYSAGWQQRCLEKLKNIMNSPNLKETLIERNYQWARTKTWKHQTENLFKQMCF